MKCPALGKHIGRLSKVINIYLSHGAVIPLLDVVFNQE
jgi:hypothetical protein